jgi:hypothetical protein
MTESLNAIVAPDQYSPQATIEDVLLSNVILDVFNAAIYWQVKHSVWGGHAGVWHSEEVYMTPGSRTVPQRDLTGVRVRAAIPHAPGDPNHLPNGAKQAVVTITAYTQNDSGL